jgi:asparagine synthase (glutamine-hydrolysing)
MFGFIYICESKLSTLCGITGIWSKKSETKQDFSSIHLATDALKHRGPDATGIKAYTNCALGHTRLAILDCDARSNQPFLSADERYSLVFNGEIYNYEFLKAKLQKRGVQFQTTSDTEVLLHQLIHYGKAGLDDLNGFYALAFYDQEENTLILARDPVGIKPLLVSEAESRVCFASEMKAMLPLVRDRSLNLKGLNQYFSLTYSAAPETVLKGIEALLPGEIRVYQERQQQSFMMRKPQPKKRVDNYEDACGQLKSLLSESVELRLIADVPVGTFLSGGLDSSIISALAKRNKPDLETFSVGFDHPYFNEQKYADEVARHINSHHNTILIDKVSFQENFDRFLKSLDQPFADSSAFAMFLLAEKTREKVSVALSGDGADELFGGYRKHMAAAHIRELGFGKKMALKSLKMALKPLPSSRSGKWGDLKRKMNRFEQGLNLAHPERHWFWCQFINDSARKMLLKPELYQSIKSPVIWSENDLNAELLADQSLVLPNDMLKKVDAMSMAHSLEVRTPFLDQSLVAFANQLPASFKLNHKEGKRILKDTFKDLIPETILQRKKKGFEVPLEFWLKDQLSEQFNRPIFSKDYLENQAVFNSDYIQHLKKNLDQALTGDHIYLIWSLIVFQNWWEFSINT